MNKRNNGLTDTNTLEATAVFLLYSNHTANVYSDKQVTEIHLMKSYYRRHYAQTLPGGRRDEKNGFVHTARAQHHKGVE
jgi:hypothetical protein